MLAERLAGTDGPLRDDPGFFHGGGRDLVVLGFFCDSLVEWITCSRPDVRDLAAGLILAGERGQVGERYNPRR